MVKLYHLPNGVYATKRQIPKESRPYATRVPIPKAGHYPMPAAPASSPRSPTVRVYKRGGEEPEYNRLITEEEWQAHRNDVGSDYYDGDNYSVANADGSVDKYHRFYMRMPGRAPGIAGLLASFWSRNAYQNGTEYHEEKQYYHEHYSAPPPPAFEAAAPASSAPRNGTNVPVMSPAPVADQRPRNDPSRGSGASYSAGDTSRPRAAPAASPASYSRPAQAIPIRIGGVASQPGRQSRARRPLRWTDLTRKEQQCVLRAVGRERFLSLPYASQMAVIRRCRANPL